MSIDVIDAPCGYGKTTWAINYINESKNKKFIFCTPLLDELKRIIAACPGKCFKEPDYIDGNKVNGFNKLLSQNENIVVTHSTFMNSTNVTLSLIENKGYVLILDEVINAFEGINDIQMVQKSPRQAILNGDIKYLLDNSTIRINPYDYSVNWIGTESGFFDHKFSVVEQLALNNQLYCINKAMLITHFPVRMFELFPEIYILTYMFDGCLLKGYFEFFYIDYNKQTIDKSNDEVKLIEYNNSCDYEFRRQLKRLVSIYMGNNLNKSGRSLSVTWYNKASDDDLKELKKDIYNYFHNVLKTAKGPHEDIMWTCPSDYENLLKGKGYTRIRNLTAEEKKLPNKVQERLRTARKCFVPCNSVATNQYRNRWAMAYCCNISINPFICKLLNNRKSMINQDLFALSCFIQWLCRSRVRDGQEVSIYIPSERIRHLFIKWMNDADEHN